MQNFTPLTAAIGGGLIGLAVTLLWAVVGRTAGISSIAGGVIPPKRGDVLWRIAFLIGLPLGALIGSAVGPRIFSGISATSPGVGLSATGLVAAGLLVGVGTRLGHGCTSGHGICGLARLSPRSFVAVGTFMATAIATVFIVRHVL
jgi:uncharacterized membrane protein YedE/YeeE